VTARDDPLPTTMREEEQGVREERLPGLDDMCTDVPVSRYQGPGAADGCCCCTDRLLRAWIRPAWSQAGGGAALDDEAAVSWVPAAGGGTP
jgi:hypothetical protein